MGTKVFDNALDLISFSRASGGTALRKISYGSELVTNGDFSAGTTAWTFSANASVVAGAAFLDVTSPSGGTRISQNASLVSGKVYRVSFSASGVLNTSLYLGAAGAFTRQYDIVNGFNSVVLTASGSSINFWTFSNTGTSTIDNVSVKEVLFDRPDGTLTLFNHPTNVPRIEYDASGAVKGLLVEEARTNLLTWSEDFSNVIWSHVASDNVARSVTAPDGSLSTYEIYETSTTTTSYYGTYPTAQNFTAGAVVSFSVFAKANERSFIALLIGPASVYNGQYFDLSDGSKAGTEGANFTSSITDFGGGWYRCSVTFTVQSTTLHYTRILLSNDGTNRIYTGVPGNGIYVYGAQLEAGAFATSYIGTTGATATRAADIASIPVSAFGYNQQAGSVVVEWQTIGGLSDSTAQYLLGTDSSSARWAYHNSPGLMLTWDGANARNIVTSAVDRTAYTSAISTNTGLISTATGGTLAATDASTNGNLAALTNEFRVGRDHGSANYLNGHIKSITYYPRRLSNAQLQELTT